MRRQGSVFGGGRGVGEAGRGMRGEGWDGYSRDTSSARRCLAICGVRPYTTNAKKNETIGEMRRWSETVGPFGVRRCSGVRPSFDPNLGETLFSTTRPQGNPMSSHVGLHE